MNKSHKSGLYGKYQIKKADGSPVDPDANYFILRIDNDPDAIQAAMLWAKCKRNWLLYHDLEELHDEVINQCEAGRC